MFFGKKRGAWKHNTDQVLGGKCLSEEDVTQPLILLLP